MRIDLQLNQATTPWSLLRDHAAVADEAGFDTLWVFDHLSGTVMGGHTMLDCFTLLGALAVATHRIGLGTLVANVGTRHPAVLALAAASVQSISNGRFTLGLGAGASPTSRYASEQIALAMPIPATLAARHQRVIEALDLFEQLWSADRDDRFAGFSRPEPPPPVILGVNTPRLARLAGARTCGVNAWAANPDLAVIISAANEARAARPAHHSALGAVRRDLWTVSAWARWDPALLQADHPEQRRLQALGVDRLVLVCLDPEPAETVLEAARAAGLPPPTSTAPTSAIDISVADAHIGGDVR